MTSITRSAQSRLKSRKVLGVGEGADGNIPRSKISQLLGHHEMEPWSLPTIHYPAGLRLFQCVTCLYFVTIGLISILSPGLFFRFSSNFDDGLDLDALVRHLAEDRFQQSDAINLQAMLTLPFHLYGVTMLSLASLFLLSTFRNRSNRICVRVSLIVEAFYFVCDIIVTNVLHGVLPPSGNNLVYPTLLKAIAVISCAAYYTMTSSEQGQKRQD